ncbi:MAG: hypothetical protein ACAI25_18700 [Planctomycetota bacterium]
MSSPFVPDSSPSILPRALLRGLVVGVALSVTSVVLAVAAVAAQHAGVVPAFYLVLTALTGLLMGVGAGTPVALLELRAARVAPSRARDAVVGLATVVLVMLGFLVGGLQCAYTVYAVKTGTVDGGLAGVRDVLHELSRLERSEQFYWLGAFCGVPFALGVVTRLRESSLGGQCLAGALGTACVAAPFVLGCLARFPWIEGDGKMLSLCVFALFVCGFAAVVPFLFRLSERTEGWLGRRLRGEPA